MDCTENKTSTIPRKTHGTYSAVGQVRIEGLKATKRITERYHYNSQNIETVHFENRRSNCTWLTWTSAYGRS
jgi:hypothetical protein